MVDHGELWIDTLRMRTRFGKATGVNSEIALSHVAKYYLGKVKRERSWPVVSAFAVRDLRGGPWILQGFLWARGQRCLCIVALLADRIGSIAYYCHGSLQRVADSR